MSHIWAEFIEDELSYYPIDLVINHKKEPMTLEEAKALLITLKDSIEMAEARLEVVNA